MIKKHFLSFFFFFFFFRLQLGDEEIYANFSEIISKAKKFAGTELKGAVTELETRLLEKHQTVSIYFYLQNLSLNNSQLWYQYSLCIFYTEGLSAF